MNNKKGIENKTTSKKHSDKTAAETKSIGFDYQYYFFLWKVLALKSGESVGLEVKDDVHIQLSDNKLILYQIKHTVQKKSDGTPKNLTESDDDLWKTLSNWAKLISDKNDGREQENKQRSYLKNTRFVLATNKSSGAKNNILVNFVLLQNESVTLISIKETFQDFANASKNNDIKSYITDILKLDDSVLEAFLSQVSFELDEDDIIQKCKNEIRSDKIPENKIEDVYRDVDSAIREDNFIDVKSGKKIEVTYDDFLLKYRRHYDLARSPSLTIRPFSGTMPDQLEDQVFIQQLLEIQDIQSDDIEAISEFTRFRLKLNSNIDEWIQRGEITDGEVESLKEEAVSQWKNEFRASYRAETVEPSYNAKGLSILDLLRKSNLEVDGQKLGADMSNGEFYELANTPIIGWRKDWEKYKK